MSETIATMVEAFRLDILGKLLLAVVLGGAIGLERELRRKPAGLRTNILICLGATLFTELSIVMAGEHGDPSRIAAQIVTGVGFLGAGTILHDRGAITGLTSAATIWLVAAIGVAVGAGAALEASGAALLVVVVLGALGWVEEAIGKRAITARVTIWADAEGDRVAAVERAFRELGAPLADVHVSEQGSRVRITASVRGNRRTIEMAQGSALGVGKDVSVTVDA